jgi:glycosyltransferase involved in cell wall biosynthesis
MKHLPEYSIIIPTYNHAEYLGRCIESLLCQTNSNWEAIIVNNFSQDNTIVVVNKYQDERIKLINFSNNGVIAASRNIGIRQAQSSYVAFLDSDDWWYPNKLETITKYLSQGEILYHDLDLYTPRGKRRFKKSQGRRLAVPPFIDLIVNGNAIPNSSAVVKKTLLEQVGGLSEDRNLVAVEDYDLWLRLGKITDKFHYIPQSLGGYWVGDTSISEVSKKQVARIEALYERHLQDVGCEHVGAAMAFKKYCLGGLYYKMGLFDEALPFLTEARRVNSSLTKLKSYCYRLLIYGHSMKKHRRMSL